LFDSRWSFLRVERGFAIENLLRLVEIQRRSALVRALFHAVVSLTAKLQAMTSYHCQRRPETSHA
jgi:hypothetical protein